MQAGLILLVGVHACIANQATDPPSPNATGFATTQSVEGTSEESLVAKIKKLAEARDRDTSSALNVRRDLLAHIATLLARFPQTAFREEALVFKLETLASLARGQPAYLDQLLGLTAELDRKEFKGRLAEENAYYAIQAFVLGARAERMPAKRRLKGAQERYQAFLEDYPKSRHRPVVMASLVRNLLALDKTGEAQKSLGRLEREFPDHSATRRARGEVYRATAVGRPFPLAQTDQAGSTVRTSDFAGKVLVVHFWASWSEASVKAFPELVELYEKHKKRGLVLLGVNGDRDSAGMQDSASRLGAKWDQIFGGRGMRSELFIECGVVRLPTYFVIDREGIVRSTDPGKRLADLIEQLLASSGKEPSLPPGT